MAFTDQSEGKPSDLIVATLTLAAVLPRRVDACHACIFDESAFVSLTVQNKCIVVPLSFIRYVVRCVLVWDLKLTELYSLDCRHINCYLKIPVTAVRDC